MMAGTQVLILTLRKDFLVFRVSMCCLLIIKTIAFYQLLFAFRSRSLVIYPPLCLISMSQNEVLVYLTFIPIKHI
jgi:hypothetical protein